MPPEQETHHHTEEVTTTTTKKPNILVRVAVIAGMLIILFFIAGLIVNFVPKFLGKAGTASVSLSSFFSPKTNIVITAEPGRVASGQDVKISWKNTGTDNEGKMIWKFECVDGAVIKYNSISGKKDVKCNTNFPLPSTGNYSFTAINNTDKEITIPNSVSLYDEELKNVKVSGKSTFSILPVGYEVADTNTSNNGYSDVGTSTPSTNNDDRDDEREVPRNTNTGNTYNNPTPTQNRGIADLTINAISISGIDSNGNYKANSVNENDRVLFKFRVANIGTGRSGTWQLQGTLPTKVAFEKVYYSPTQPALNSGDSYEMTMSFDSYDPSISSIVLSIVGGDNNTSNNTMTLRVPYSGGTSGGGGTTGTKADLTVRVIEVGVMDENTNVFYSTNSLNSDDKIAMKFEVENIGGQNTGTWRFKVDMPTEDEDTFYSGAQSSLAPGQKTIFTIGFDNPDTGTNTITVEVDYDDDINENKENNNEASRTIRVNN